MALALFLGSSEAFSLNARAIAPTTQPRISAPSMSEYDINTSFRFGTGDVMPGQLGGTGAWETEEEFASKQAIGGATPQDNFRFGSGQTSIGWQGGAGNGMGEDTAQPVTMTGPADSFAFGSAPQAIGFQGGAGKGMGEDIGVPTVQAGLENSFRFGSGRTTIGYQGGAGKGMGVDEEYRSKQRIGGATSRDDFRFKSGAPSTNTIGFQGGTYPVEPPY